MQAPAGGSKENLFVLKFIDEATAQRMLDVITQLQTQKLIKCDDAALVTRRADGRPKIRQAHNLVGAGAMGGAFWGLLVGMLFLNPLVGMAIGAGAGALSGKMADIGIDDNFIKQVSNAIQPGEAALFLLTREAVMDKIIPQIKDIQFQVIQTSLSSQDEAQLREMLGSARAQ
ncbi:DUF1269 domain-containing protein [Ktedonobacter racemifer]|uniref:Membrane protein of uknown function UCP014873 n=1 Tax=Ktedonobacter racemifer DSM 44963 TaxID=485913 RepID=D6U1I4_KTERA|nr:DUF1269 domain-containing protein [Ktedonobacter racemifer]EFH82628.1 membrane protein of uknown function UCP014873 [Ktedonobacter racemifer DSM 44963]